MYVNQGLIHKYFDLEGYFPDYTKDKAEAFALKEILKEKGYKYNYRRGQAIFKSKDCVFIGQGSNELECITQAFYLYLRSYEL